MSRSGQLVRSVGNAPGHRGLDTARETTPAVHRCGYRPRELQPARRRRLGRASSGVSRCTCELCGIRRCQPRLRIPFGTATAAVALLRQRAAKTCHEGERGDFVVQLGRQWRAHLNLSRWCAKKPTRQPLHRPRPPHAAHHAASIMRRNGDLRGEAKRAGRHRPRRAASSSRVMAD